MRNAAIVVGARVNVVDADRVGAQSVHEVGIASALVVVDERVIWQELVSDTLYVRSVESIFGHVGEDSIPLRKNWFPSRVKNLEPLAVMVGMACAMLARRPRMRKSSICAGEMVSGQLKWMCGKKWRFESGLSEKSCRHSLRLPLILGRKVQTGKVRKTRLTTW